MSIMYLVVEENEDTATVEFIDSDTQLTTKRQINIYGLDEAGKHERFTSHERAFVHRIGINMIKPEPEQTTVLPPEEPLPNTDEPQLAV
jgi:hypothetical protein